MMLLTFSTLQLLKVKENIVYKIFLNLKALCNCAYDMVIIINSYLTALSLGSILISHNI